MCYSKQKIIIFLFIIFAVGLLYNILITVILNFNLLIFNTNVYQTDSDFPDILPKFRWCPKKEMDNFTLDCETLFSGNNESFEFAKNWVSPCSYQDSEIANLTENCSKFEENVIFWSRYREKTKTSDKSYSDSDSRENDYPLAFVIVVARNAEQVIRLFQSVYTKRNLYCFAYDNKTNENVKRTLQNLNKCYDNVLMPKKFVNVYWSGFSILETAMNCLKVLHKQTNHKWKYVQILSWNDYPLRTNEEMIKIMQIFNGSQDSFLDRQHLSRSRYYYNVNKTSPNMKEHYQKDKMGKTKPIPPGNLIEYKGSLATTMSREFVGFLFENPISRKFYQWSNTTYMAEEMYFSTLIHNLHINPPGGFPGVCADFYKQITRTEKSYISRFQEWYWNGGCKSRRSTWYSCVYGIADLHTLYSRPELMAHKLYLEFQPATYYCLAELHFNKTLYPESYPKLNFSFYENLPAVRYQRLVDKSTFKC